MQVGILNYIWGWITGVNGLRQQSEWEIFWSAVTRPAESVMTSRIGVAMRNSRTLFFPLAALLGMCSAASAQFLTVYAGPSYDQSTQIGFQNPEYGQPPDLIAGDEASVGTALKYDAGANLGLRAVRLDASGGPAIELANLGTTSAGFTSVSARAINLAGTAVGSATKYVSNASMGSRAVRWDSVGVATELDALSTNNGFTTSFGYAINAAGTAVGWAETYSNGLDVGERAVRWDASGTAATELGNLGTTTGGLTFSQARAVNSSGTAVGTADRWSVNTNIGQRAVRWSASGTAATELGGLGLFIPNFSTDAAAYAINDAGTAVGYAEKIVNGTTTMGDRAVRWAASGTTATELGNLGTNSSGSATSEADSINSAGTAVGYAEKYNASGTDLGQRAVRWDASGTAATELGNLGVSTNGLTTSRAYEINSAGLAVGNASVFAGNTLLGQHAVVWDLSGAAIDLNTLIDPSSGWTLMQAEAISDTNWVTGVGTFDPDGAAGPLAAYSRLFLLNVGSLVPEPQGWCLPVICIGLITSRSGRNRRPFSR
jgi:hypothetical protein